MTANNKKETNIYRSTKTKISIFFTSFKPNPLLVLKQLFEWPWQPSRSHAELQQAFLFHSFYPSQTESQRFQGRNPTCFHGRWEAQKPVQVNKNCQVLSYSKHDGLITQ